MQQNHKEMMTYPIKLGKILKKLHSFPDPILKAYNLSRIHVHYLVHLEHCKKSLNAKALSEALGVDKANTSRALQDLIKGEYVIRTEVDHALVITEKGKAVANAIKDNQVQEMEKLLSILTEHERTTLREILTKISENI